MIPTHPRVRNSSKFNNKYIILKFKLSKNKLLIYNLALFYERESEWEISGGNAF